MPREADSSISTSSIEQAILNSTSSFIFAIDRDGIFLYATPSVAKAFGLTPEDVIGKTWDQIELDLNAMAQINRSREEVFAASKAIRGEVWSPTAKRFFQYEASPLKKDGETIAVVFTLTDTTALKAMCSMAIATLAAIRGPISPGLSALSLSALSSLSSLF